MLDLCFFLSHLLGFYISSFLADIRLLTTTQSLLSLYNSKVILNMRTRHQSWARRTDENSKWRLLDHGLPWHHDFKPAWITPAPSAGFRCLRINAAASESLFSLSFVPYLLLGLCNTLASMPPGLIILLHPPLPLDLMEKQPLLAILGTCLTLTFWFLIFLAYLTWLLWVLGSCWNDCSPSWNACPPLGLPL